MDIHPFIFQQVLIVYPSETGTEHLDHDEEKVGVKVRGEGTGGGGGVRRRFAVMAILLDDTTKGKENQRDPLVPVQLLTKYYLKIDE